MAKTIELYECECGRRFRDLEQAETCEKSHIKPVKISNQNYDENGKYPHCITVIMKDGYLITYYKDLEA